VPNNLDGLAAVLASGRFVAAKEAAFALLARAPGDTRPSEALVGRRLTSRCGRVDARHSRGGHGALHAQMLIAGERTAGNCPRSSKLVEEVPMRLTGPIWRVELRRRETKRLRRGA